MSYNEEDLLETVIVPSSPDDVLLSTLQELMEDIKVRGQYETETSGLYYKALALVYEDSLMSYGKFSGTGGILDE